MFACNRLQEEDKSKNGTKKITFAPSEMQNVGQLHLFTPKKR